MRITQGVLLLSVLILAACGGTRSLREQAADIEPLEPHQVIRSDYLQADGEREVPVLLVREGGAGAVDATFMVDDEAIAVLQSRQSIRIYLAPGSYSFRFVPDKGEPGEAYAEFPVEIDPKGSNEYLFHVDERGPVLVKLPPGEDQIEALEAR